MDQDLKPIFKRLRDIREYRRLKQDDVAKWFDISGASYGRKERGLEGGFGLEEITLFLDKTNFMSSYLFGETDSLEAADKKRQKPLDVASELNELKLVVEKKIPVSSKRDPLADYLGDQVIRDIIISIKPLSPSLKQNALGYCRGLSAVGSLMSTDSDSESNEKKRNGTEG